MPVLRQRRREPFRVGEAGRRRGEVPAAGCGHRVEGRGQRSSRRWCRAVERSDLGEAVRRLGVQPGDHPEPAGCGRHPVRRRRVTRRDRPAQYRGDVVRLGAEPRDPLQLPGAPQLRFGGLHQLDDQRRVGGLDRRALARVVQLLRGVLADRLQHPVPGRRSGYRDDQRLLDQCGEHVERRVARTAHPRRRVLGRAAGEDRQPPRQRALGFVEQVPAPVDDRTQGLVPRRSRPRAVREQPEPVAEAAADLVDRERAQASRRQFDRQRLPVELTADLGHGRPQRGGDREARRHGGGPIGEQAYRVVVGQGVDGMQHLTRHTERLAARREDPQAGRSDQEGFGEPRGGVDEVLAVVQHEQELAAGQGGDQARSGAGVVGDPRDDLGGTDGGEHGGGQLVRAAERGQLRDPGLAGHAPGDLAGQPGLAGATRPGQRDQPRRREQTGQPPDVRRAPDEARQRCGHRTRRGQAAQHRGVGGRERRAGIDAQLLDEPRPHAVEHREGVDLPAARVQAPSQQRGGRLPERFRGQQRVEGVEVRGLSETQCGLGGQLDGRRPEPVEAGGGGLGEGQPADVARAGPRQSALASASSARACAGSSSRAVVTSDSNRCASTSCGSTSSR